MVFFDLLIEKRSKVIYFNQIKDRNRSTIIKIWSKSWSSTQIRRWILNRTKINNWFCVAWNLNRRRLDSRALIALAYKIHCYIVIASQLVFFSIFFRPFIFLVCCHIGCWGCQHCFKCFKKLIVSKLKWHIAIKADCHQSFSWNLLF